MANNKVGFEFYRLDTDRYQDIKIKRLKKDFKCSGIAVYDYIINEIYRVKGCYLEWDDNVAFDIADYWGLDENIVVEIIAFCCKIGLFNKAVFDSKSVITSKSIQVRFVKMSKLAKRNDVIIPEEYNLIPEESYIIQEECTDNSGSLPQRREEKSKEEKRRGERKEKEKIFAPPTLQESIIFFEDRMPEHFWDLSKCKSEAKNFIDYYSKTNWQTRNGPITNWENAASGWISKDAEFSKEKKVNGKAFPNHFNKTYIQTLGPDEQKKYRAHLNNLGIFYLGDDRLGNAIWGAKN
jgi:hypothetical protein